MMRKVSKHSPLPLYYQLKEILQEMIDNEELKPGDAAPPERELCEIHGISRMTARRAVMALVNKGVLYREQGKGTFVAEPKPEHQINLLRGFTEEMEAKGLKVRTEILSFQELQPTVSMRKKLKLTSEKTRIVELRRMRYVDEEPFALETAWLNLELAKGFHQQDLVGKSLYDVLRDRYGVKICYATQTIEPIQLDEFEGELFGLKPHSLALLFCRRTYTDQDKVIEYTKCIYRADRHKYEVLLNANM